MARVLEHGHSGCDAITASVEMDLVPGNALFDRRQQYKKTNP